MASAHSYCANRARGPGYGHHEIERPGVHFEKEKAMLFLVRDDTIPTPAHAIGNSNGSGAPAQAASEVTIRTLASDDAPALRSLAERDTAAIPAGSIVGAERDGRLQAAISLSSGHVVADPFRPTADLVAMLKLRAGQMPA